MKARIDAGTDVAMIGAWDVRQNDSPFTAAELAVILGSGPEFTPARGVVGDRSAHNLRSVLSFRVGSVGTWLQSSSLEGEIRDLTPS